MSEYGITPQGFNNKDFTILKQELLERWEASWGDIDSAPDGFFGQLADSLGYAHTEFWEVVQKIYLNINPQTATDTHLVRLLGLIGMTPLPATNASVDVLCGGFTGTVIPAGSSVAKPTQSATFVSTEDVTLTDTEMNRYNVKVSAVLNDGDEVFVETDAQVAGGVRSRVSVTVDVVNGIDTPQKVAERLVDAYKGNSVLMDISEAIIDPENDDTVIVTTNSPYRTVRLNSQGHNALIRVWRTINFTASEPGVFITPPLTVTAIKSGVANWTDAVNLVSGRAGSNAETDADLRRRLTLYKQIGSTGSRNAIESKIWQNVKGIANVIINQNDSDFTDTFGRPPHSMHCITDGGDEDEIAAILVANLPAGITTFGNVSKSVPVTWQTDPFVVNFDRINSIFGWVKIVVKSLNPEENLPANAKELIKKSVYNDSLQNNVLGGDIITQKFVGSVYKAVPGIQVVEIQCAVTGRPATTPTDVGIGLPWQYDPTTYSSGWEKVKVVVAPYDRVEWRDGFDRILVEGI